MVEFVLKDGTSLGRHQWTEPPFMARFSIPATQVPALREQAPKVLRAGHGPLSRFLASVLESGSLNQPGTREITACVLVAMGTDTNERLAAIMEGRVSMVGFSVTRNRALELATAMGQVRRIPGAGLWLSPPAKARWEFHYFCRT